MGSVVDAVGDVFGGAADFVGDVVGGVGDVVGDIASEVDIADAIMTFAMTGNPYAAAFAATDFDEDLGFNPVSFYDPTSGGFNFGFDNVGSNLVSDQTSDQITNKLLENLAKTGLDYGIQSLMDNRGQQGGQPQPIQPLTYQQTSSGQNVDPGFFSQGLQYLSMLQLPELNSITDIITSSVSGLGNILLKAFGSDNLSQVIKKYGPAVLSVIGGKLSYDDQKRINDIVLGAYNKYNVGKEFKGAQYRTGQGLAALPVLKGGRPLGSQTVATAPQRTAADVVYRPKAQNGGIMQTLPMDYGQPLQIPAQQQTMFTPTGSPTSSPLLNYGQTELGQAGGTPLVRTNYQEGGLSEFYKGEEPIIPRIENIGGLLDQAEKSIGEPTNNFTSPLATTFSRFGMQEGGSTGQEMEDVKEFYYGRKRNEMEDLLDEYQRFKMRKDYQRKYPRDEARNGGRMKYADGSMGLYRPDTSKPGISQIMPTSKINLPPAAATRSVAQRVMKDPQTMKSLMSNPKFLQILNSIKNKKASSAVARPMLAYGSLPMRTNQAGITELDYRQKGGFVPPIGIKEKADDIPAMLSNNEFVFTADAVRGAGGGSVNKGAKKMYGLMKQLEGKS
jgi:hypothetical protein